MAKQIYKIIGRIINLSKQPLANLRVEAWDKDLIFDDFLGEAITDQNGRFNIEFTLERFRELFFDHKPDLYFKIYAEKKCILNTIDSVLWNIDRDLDSLEIMVDLSPGELPADQEIVFTGTVKHSNGNTIANLKIVVSQQLLRGKTKLEESVTNAHGYYSIKPATSAGNMTCIVEAFDNAGKTVASSDLLFHPQGSVKNDLTVSDPRYKGEAHFNIDSPVLKGFYEQLSQSNNNPLTIGDVFFIANQAKQEPQDTFRWIRSKQLESETGIPAEAFYGMFKQGLPTNPSQLSAIDGNDIKSALVKAATGSSISDTTAAQADAIVSKWNNYIISKGLAEIPKKLDASLGTILGFAIPDEAMKQKVMNGYLAHGGAATDFWNGLSTITGDPSSALKIQNSLKVAVLAGNQPDVMSALINRESKSGNLFHDLASMNKDDWKNLISGVSAQIKRSAIPTFIEGATGDERLETYATRMTRMLEQSFPTHSFFGKLTNQNDNDTGFKMKQELVHFFSNNSTFDLANTPTISLLEENSPFSFQGIENKQTLVQELQSAQRLNSYTTDFNAITFLKKNGFDSAINIVSIPENKFIQDYSPQ
ncbi:MAG: hypothetical protein WCL00_10425, partial [Bacteroidota bacterium]